MFTAGSVRQVVEYHISSYDQYFEKKIAWQYAQYHSVSWQGEKNRKKQTK